MRLHTLWFFTIILKTCTLPITGESFNHRYFSYTLIYTRGSVEMCILCKIGLFRIQHKSVTTFSLSSFFTRFSRNFACILRTHIFYRMHISTLVSMFKPDRFFSCYRFPKYYFRNQLFLV